MSVVINTNSAAISASNNLATSNAMLQRSLNRLSSGSKIVNPSDDAGGLAVSMKLSATIKRTAAVNDNIANARSFLQTQDGAFQTATKVLDRMSELKVLSDDVTKNQTDKDNYDTEFQQLKKQLSALVDEKFNGVSLFGNGGSGSLAVATTEKGSAGNTVSIDQPDLATQIGATLIGNDSTTVTAMGISTITNAIQNIASLRASNGAQSNRLSFASEMLTVNRENLEAANSRIIDVDVAEESTQLARYNILVQAGSSMLAQANSSTQVALKLLG
ncbi:flagellin [Pelagicoccus sp. SDUM812003]|uniref:flagellin n=1 Tax=Pelagicoccus sp. SDUM812003 TaxID=3041267 RepID=UPI0028107631|nr:flagellin [Pelagicoccus sp. SDUM812003]MDQ8201530.1 flagellin [Pelagicoccus sp. SDUM812003]